MKTLFIGLLTLLFLTVCLNYWQVNTASEIVFQDTDLELVSDVWAVELDTSHQQLGTWQRIIFQENTPEIPLAKPIWTYHYWLMFLWFLGLLGWVHWKDSQIKQNYDNY